VLNAIYETDFVGFSCGFRPGRGQHNALDAVDMGIKTRKVSWVLDADIRDFLGSVSHEWVVKFLGAPDCGSARRAAHPEMAEGRRAEGWGAKTNGGRDAAGW
jgi:hypothetical protein